MEITRLDTGPCRLFVKLESQNPGGSIKDRIAGLSAMAEWHDVARLAFRDYSHEWHVSGCFILGLAAVLAPLLVLFRLKYGLVTSMLTALAEDPEKRELKRLGSGHYTAVWFRGLRARPEVAFVSSRTRTLAATLELSSKTAPVILPAELIPSGQHDPLLKGLARRPAGLHEVVLSGRRPSGSRSPKARS